MKQLLKEKRFNACPVDAGVVFDNLLVIALGLVEGRVVKPMAVGEDLVVMLQLRRPLLEHLGFQRVGILS